MSRCLAFIALLLVSTAFAEPYRLNEDTAPRLVRTDDARAIRHDTSVMGTDVSFIVVSDKPDSAWTAIHAAEQEMRRIESLLTDWEPEEHQGDIARINLNAARQAVPVANETFRLLEAAIELGHRSSGKFDVSYAAVGQLWNFKPAGAPPTLPDAAQLHAALARVDYRQIELDATTQSVRFNRPGMRIGLGGIAKGYAVDRAVQVLRAAALDDFVVNAGGDLAVAGPLNEARDHGAALWRVGIQNPRDKERLVALLPAANLSVATSGDYERFFELQGVRYSHLLDPDTGYPARLCQSVTVVAARTYLADALATAVFILGPERGMQLVESEAGVEALIIDATGELHRSSGLAASQPDI